MVSDAISNRALAHCKSIINSLFDTNNSNKDVDQEENRLLHEMKENFFKREYLDVFVSSDRHLAVYFKHYVPARVLCYLDLFISVKQLSDVLSGRSMMIGFELERRRAQRKRIPLTVEHSDMSQLEVTCIGAGAGSESLALIHFFINEFKKDRVVPQQVAVFSDFCDQLDGMQVDRCHVHIVDIADWSRVQNCIMKPKAVKTISQRIHFDFTQADILECISSNNTDVLDKLKRSALITFMFVLNELFAVSKRKPVEFITWMMENVPANHCLLFVDSAGSFSDLSVGSANVKIFQLLDGIKCLETLAAEDSRWFRPQTSQSDGFEMQNMRYFYRLYRKR